MAVTTQHARITEPVPYRANSGRLQRIPVGPCLVEQLDGESVGIIWGASGQSSVALPVEQVEAARGSGQLVLLD
ncbi:hypothetical protein DBR42_20775 [Pelomonas sp. HMWF004]|nr:hypothetical protein DBR42_20775 [Pelomonas sp. HMWF004]